MSYSIATLFFLHIFHIVYVSNNSVFHDCTKHIEVDCHFVRDILTFGSLSTSYVPTGHQLADILTKALCMCQFCFLPLKLDISDIHAPTWGGVLDYMLIKSLVQLFLFIKLLEFLVQQDFLILTRLYIYFLKLNEKDDEFFYILNLNS